MSFPDAFVRYVPEAEVALLENSMQECSSPMG